MSSITSTLVLLAPLVLLVVLVLRGNGRSYDCSLALVVLLVLLVLLVQLVLPELPVLLALLVPLVLGAYARSSEETGGSRKATDGL